MNSEEIKNIVTAIRESKVRNKSTHFATIFADFKTKYPVLYEKVCSGDIDDKNLNFMLHMLQKVQTQEKSQYDASAFVGQMLYDRYVAPGLSNAPPAGAEPPK